MNIIIEQSLISERDKSDVKSKLQNDSTFQLLLENNNVYDAIRVMPEELKTAFISLLNTCGVEIPRPYREIWEAIQCIPTSWQHKISDYGCNVYICHDNDFTSRFYNVCDKYEMQLTGSVEYDFTRINTLTQNKLVVTCDPNNTEVLQIQVRDIILSDWMDGEPVGLHDTVHKVFDVLDHLVSLV